MSPKYVLLSQTLEVIATFMFQLFEPTWIDRPRHHCSNAVLSPRWRTFNVFQRSCFWGDCVIVLLYVCVGWGVCVWGGGLALACTTVSQRALCNRGEGGDFNSCRDERRPVSRPSLDIWIVKEQNSSNYRCEVLQYYNGETSKRRIGNKQKNLHFRWARSLIIILYSLFNVKGVLYSKSYINIFHQSTYGIYCQIKRYIVV